MNDASKLTKQKKDRMNGTKFTQTAIIILNCVAPSNKFLMYLPYESLQYQNLSTIQYQMVIFRILFVVFNANRHSIRSDFHEKQLK